ncbi:hypothetical protein GCM10023405_30840 [Streptomonospora salina]
MAPMRSPWTAAATAAAAGVAAAGLAAGGGYALRAATAGGVDPLPAPTASDPPAATPGEDGAGASAEAPAPLGNDAGLTYTRMDGASYLRVVDGQAVARITPTAAESDGDAVTVAFEGEYLADGGELVLEPGQFFHYPGGGAPQPDGIDRSTVFAAGDAPLATLAPGDAEQEFSATLEGAPDAGAISYFAETDQQEDPYYRLPVCYRVGGTFTAEREECEQVPRPDGSGS